MNVLQLIVTLLTIVHLVAAASHPNSGGNDLRDLSEEDYDRLMEIIMEDDSPECISAFLDDCHRRIRCNNYLFNLLDTVIQYGHTKSFLLLFPCIDFDDGGHRKNMWVLFLEAFIKYNFDLCDYLLFQDFPIGKALRPMWDRLSTWHIDDLMALANRHPDRIPELVPTPAMLTICPYISSLLTMIDFIAHCTSVNEALARDPDYHPTQLLARVIENRSLDDIPMIRLFDRLLTMGAAVDQATLDELSRIHPGSAECFQVLLDALSPDIKEPECKEHNARIGKDQ